MSIEEMEKKIIEDLRNAVTTKDKAGFWIALAILKLVGKT